MPMLTHVQIWKAIDALAARNGLSASGLARRAGLDPTTFNKSKRASTDGRLRWPSTESISKILEATNTDLDAFMALILAERQTRPSKALPLINLSDATNAFDGEGHPIGPAWDELAFPELPMDAVFALEVTTGNYKPAYREGDILVCSPSVPVRRGDRVLMKDKNGALTIGLLKRKTMNSVEITEFGGEHGDVIVASQDVAWIARILWVSQ